MQRQRAHLTSIYFKCRLRHAEWRSYDMISFQEQSWRLSSSAICLSVLEISLAGIPDTCLCSFFAPRWLFSESQSLRLHTVEGTVAQSSQQQIKQLVSYHSFIKPTFHREINLRPAVKFRLFLECDRLKSPTNFQLCKSMQLIFTLVLTERKSENIFRSQSKSSSSKDRSSGRKVKDFP